MTDVFALMHIFFQNCKVSLQVHLSFFPYFKGCTDFYLIAEFVTEFLALLMDASMEGSFGKKVSELYSCTLGKFHGTLLKTTFSGALLLIPRRETIINRVSRITTL